VVVADFAGDVRSLTGVAWVLVVAVVIWKLLPTIRKVISSRGFTIKAGGAEISVQQASDTLAHSVEDLREQFTALKAQVEAGADASPAGSRSETPAPSPISEGVPQLHRVLWVDDHPENNVYEVQALNRKDVTVDQVTSTADGLSATLHSSTPYDVIITDVGRRENGQERPQAGLDFIEQLREEDVTTPVFVYASANAVGRLRDAIMASGANGATSSATELLEMLGRVGLR
jgi:CheY-like chemotaxis protein